MCQGEPRSLPFPLELDLMNHKLQASGGLHRAETQKQQTWPESSLCLGFSAFKSLSETLIFAINEKLVLRVEEKSRPVKVGIEGCGLPGSGSNLSEESNCPLSHPVMEQLCVSEVPEGVSLSSDT